VDEKPHIQALERAQGWIRLPNGRALTGFSHEYERHGTTTLFAALEVATGLVHSGHYRCERHVDGILGVDFFRGRIVQIAYNEGRARILEKCDPNLPNYQILPVRICNDAFCVPVRVVGNPAQWMRLDTGCDVAMEWVMSKAEKRPTGESSIGLSGKSPRCLRTFRAARQAMFQSGHFGCSHGADLPRRSRLTGQRSAFKVSHYDRSTGKTGHFRESNIKPWARAFEQIGMFMILVRRASPPAPHFRASRVAWASSSCTRTRIAGGLPREPKYTQRITGDVACDSSGCLGLCCG